MTRFPILLSLLLPLAACTSTSLTLHYDRPANSLDEALPLGNGQTVELSWRHGKLRRFRVY